MIIATVLGKIVREIAKRNNDNPEVKTADPFVFEDLEKKFETYEMEEAPRTNSRADIYKGMAEKLKQAQAENEASEQIETADKSVYDEMLAEIERLELQVESQNKREIPGIDFNKANPISSSQPGNMAMTNSGGSLALRANPDMGSPRFDVRIPDLSLVKIHEYSDRSIILDGKPSRFALVEHNGQKGWVLESYLNFN